MVVTLASVLFLAQTQVVAPGCPAKVLRLDAAIHLDEGGFAQAKEACYEQLARRILV